jgi:hypothetical protein
LDKLFGIIRATASSPLPKKKKRRGLPASSVAECLGKGSGGCAEDHLKTSNPSRNLMIDD